MSRNVNQDAFKAGYAAGLRGVTRSAVPYSDREKAEAWESGWDDWLTDARNTAGRKVLMNAVAAAKRRQWKARRNA